MEVSEDIVIVGGGIAGLSLALALHRLGLKTLVLESSDGLRVSGAAFATWSNGWKALDALGVGESLRRQHGRLSRIVVTSATAGVPTAQATFGNHEVRCIKRRVLLETLAKELPTDTVRFSSEVVSIQISGYLKLLHLNDGSILRTKVVVGCDGVNSVVARWLGFPKPSFTKRLAIRGYLELKENHGLDPKFFQFMGKGWRCGIIPCDGTSIYWFFTWTPPRQDDDVKDNPMKIKQFVLSNITKLPHEMIAIIEKTKMEDIICSPLRFRFPWEILWRDASKDNVCVAGDAYHPMTPDLGQGACAALEDGVILARCLAEAFSMLSSAVGDMEEHRVIEMSLKKYTKMRKWRCANLIATAYIVGFMQQSNGKIMRFLRDKVFASFFAGLLLKKANFDCGPLQIP